MSNQTVVYFSFVIQKAKELDWKEKEILLKRLQDKTLQKIGKKYKVSAERIRQIEEKALDKFLAKVSQLMLLE